MTFASDGTAIICGIVRQNEGVTMPLRNRRHDRTFFTIDFRESSLLSCWRIGIECPMLHAVTQNVRPMHAIYSTWTSYVQRFKYESWCGSTAGMIFISLYCYLLRRSRVNDDVRSHVEEIKLFAGDREHCRLIFRTECKCEKKFVINIVNTSKSR